MFKSLDEEARIPKGTSKTWFDKLKRGAKLSNVSFPNRRVGQVSLLFIYFYLFCCIERETDEIEKDPSFSSFLRSNIFYFICLSCSRCSW